MSLKRKASDVLASLDALEVYKKGKAELRPGVTYANNTAVAIREAATAAGGNIATANTTRPLRRLPPPSLNPRRTHGTYTRPGADLAAKDDALIASGFEAIARLYSTPTRPSLDDLQASRFQCIEEEKKVIQLTAEKNSLKEENKQVVSELNQKTKALADAQQKADALEKEKAELQAALIESQKIAAELEEDNRSLSCKLAQNSTVSQVVKKVQRRVFPAKRCFRRSVVLLRKGDKVDVERKRKTIKSLQHRADELENESKELKSKNEELKNENKGLKNERDTLKNENNALKAMKKQLEEKLAKYESETKQEPNCQNDDQSEAEASEEDDQPEETEVAEESIPKPLGLEHRITYPSKSLFDRITYPYDRDEEDEVEEESEFNGFESGDDGQDEEEDYDDADKDNVNDSGLGASISSNNSIALAVTPSNPLSVQNSTVGDKGGVIGSSPKEYPTLSPDLLSGMPVLFGDSTDGGGFGRGLGLPPSLQNTAQATDTVHEGQLSAIKQGKKPLRTPAGQDLLKQSGWLFPWHSQIPKNGIANQWLAANNPFPMADPGTMQEKINSQAPISPFSGATGTFGKPSIVQVAPIAQAVDNMTRRSLFQQSEDDYLTTNNQPLIESPVDHHMQWQQPQPQSVFKFPDTNLQMKTGTFSMPSAPLWPNHGHAVSNKNEEDPIRALAEEMRGLKPKYQGGSQAQSNEMDFEMYNDHHINDLLATGRRAEAFQLLGQMRDEKETDQDIDMDDATPDLYASIRTDGMDQSFAPNSMAQMSPAALERALNAIIAEGERHLRQQNIASGAARGPAGHDHPERHVGAQNSPYGPPRGPADHNRPERHMRAQNSPYGPPRGPADYHRPLSNISRRPKPASSLRHSADVPRYGRSEGVSNTSSDRRGPRNSPRDGNYTPPLYHHSSHPRSDRNYPAGGNLKVRGGGNSRYRHPKNNSPKPGSNILSRTYNHGPRGSSEFEKNLKENILIFTKL